MKAKTVIYLYRIQPTRREMLTEGPTIDEEQVIDAHFEFLQKLTGQGIVLLAGRTLNNDPSSFGIIILQAESEKAARQLMLSDPAVSNGVMRAELFPFRIALCSNAIRKNG